MFALTKRGKQKAYFQKKLKAVQCHLWDVEFSRWKKMATREEVRRDYDGLRAKLEVLSTRITAEREPGKLKETNLDEFKRLEDDKVILERDIERKLGQLKGLDLEIHGSQPTPEHPDGVAGIQHELDALREFQVLVRQYKDLL